MKKFTKSMFSDIGPARQILENENGHLSVEEQLTRAQALIKFAQGDNYDIKVNDTFALILAL